MDYTYYTAKDLRKFIKKHQMYYAVCSVDPEFKANYKILNSGFDGLSNEDTLKFLKGMCKRLERASNALPFLLPNSTDEDL